MGPDSLPPFASSGDKRVIRVPREYPRSEPEHPVSSQVVRRRRFQHCPRTIYISRGGVQDRGHRRAPLRHAGAEQCRPRAG